MRPSFHQADRQTYRRVVIAGVPFCIVFVVISFSLRPRTEESHALVKADPLTRTAGEGRPAN